MSHAELRPIVTKKYGLKGTVVVAFALSKPFSPAMNHSLAATGATDSAVINVDWLRTRVSLTHAITIRSRICALTRASSLFLSFFPPPRTPLFFCSRKCRRNRGVSALICASLYALVCDALKGLPFWLKKSLAGFFCGLGSALSLEQW